MTRGKICCLVLQRTQGDGKSDIFFLCEDVVANNTREGEGHADEG